MLHPRALYLHPDQANGLLYERETWNATPTHNHYVTANGEVVALVTLENGTWATKYFHHDSLGSLSTITDATGAVLERMAYDSWGKRRFANGTTDPGDTIHADPTVRYNTDRGYTNHEMLDELGLIHMNGRVYDPAIARFITPDPTVPNPEWMQDYNHFSYVQNNPFTSTDPTGFSEEGDDNTNTQNATNNQGKTDNSPPAQDQSKQSQEKTDTGKPSAEPAGQKNADTATRSSPTVVAQVDVRDDKESRDKEDKANKDKEDKTKDQNQQKEGKELGIAKTQLARDKEDKATKDKEDKAKEYKDVKDKDVKDKVVKEDKDKPTLVADLRSTLANLFMCAMCWATKEEPPKSPPPPPIQIIQQTNSKPK